MSAQPSVPGPAFEAPPEPPWEGMLCGADGERQRGPLTAPRRRDALPRHCAGEVVDDSELVSGADVGLSVWLAGVVVGVLAVLGGVGWVVAALPGSASSQVQAGQTLRADPGRNVVLVLTDSAGTTVAAAVVNTNARQATCVMTPRRLVVDVRGTGPAPLSAAFGTSDAVGVDAVSDTLGVRVDGAWRLSSRGLATLVDTMGGVRVDTAARFDPDTGKLVHGLGPQTPLGGAAAAQFAIGGKGGPWETQRLARFHAVLDGILYALPDDAAQQKQVLTRAGPEVHSTLPPEQFLSFVGDLHRHARAQDLEDAVLPVVQAAPDRASGYDVDAAKFKTLLDGPLADVRRPVKVLVQGDGGSGASPDEVRSKLEKARLSVVSGGNAASGAKTVVAATSDSPSAQTRARDVAAALGLPPSSVVVEKLRDVTYDVMVTLGADFQDLLKLAGLTAAAVPSPTSS
jgi:anionic cell wall polymer biosynthesis LytR-Cps2A-Psr (LCP) family protein